jgi:hypothetical protein
MEYFIAGFAFVDAHPNCPGRELLVEQRGIEPLTEPSLFYGLSFTFAFSNVVCGRRHLQLCFSSISPKSS